LIGQESLLSSGPRPEGQLTDLSAKKMSHIATGLRMTGVVEYWRD
jgi:hypothetical protein